MTSVTTTIPIMSDPVICNLINLVLHLNPYLTKRMKYISEMDKKVLKEKIFLQRCLMNHQHNF